MNHEPAQIYSLMAKVLAELPSIGKNQENKAQGFRFRGVDDVVDQLNVKLSAVGVVPLPRVKRWETGTRQTTKGNPVNVTHLEVEYTFYAPDGSFVVASMVGEGQDSGDKSTSKAASMAFKYALVQTFCIATKEMVEDDPDRGVEDATSLPTGRAPAPQAPPPIDPDAPEWAKKLRSVLNNLPADVRAQIRPALLELSFGEPFPTKEEQADHWKRFLQSRGYWPVERSIEGQRKETLDRAKGLHPETLERLREEMLRELGVVDWENLTADHMAWVHQWIDSQTSAVVPAS